MEPRVGPGDVIGDPVQVVERVQEDGTCWLSGTQWDGDHAMRISVSNWRTTPEDVESSAAAILEAARVGSAA